MNDKLTQANNDNSKDCWRFHHQSDGLKMSQHWHTHYELLLIYKGDVSLIFGRQWFQLQSPSIILYRPFTLHKIYASPGCTYERSMINFTVADMSLFSDMLLSMSFMGDLPLLVVPLNGQQMQKFDALFGAIFENPGDFTENRLYIALIVYHVYREAEKQRLFGSNTLKRQYISGVLQYITENLSEPLHLEATAESFRVGRTKLNRDLRTVTGMTFKEYLTELRMNKAKQLMEDGSNVTRAALECGYNSESNFIVTYRRRWGCTPGENRKKER